MARVLVTLVVIIGTGKAQLLANFSTKFKDKTDPADSGGNVGHRFSDQNKLQLKRTCEEKMLEATPHRSI